MKKSKVDPSIVPGTRIELIFMADDPQPVRPMTRGTVDHVDDAGNIHMLWDDGRRLSLNPSVDEFRTLTLKEYKAEREMLRLEDILKRSTCDIRLVDQYTKEVLFYSGILNADKKLSTFGKRVVAEIGLITVDDPSGSRSVLDISLLHDAWDDFEYESPSEPCRSCHRAEWIDMYGTMVYGCDMGNCIQAEPYTNN